MKFPTASYNLTMSDFSSMKGFSPREVFEKIFISTGRYSLLDNSLGDIETKYQGISINEAYLNRNLFDFGEIYKEHLMGLKRNRIYAPFFFCLSGKVILCLDT